MTFRVYVLCFCVSARLFAGESSVNMDRVIDDEQACGLDINDGPLGPSVVETILGANVATVSQAPTNVRGSSSLFVRNGAIGGTINALNSSEIIVSGGRFVRNADVFAAPSPIINGNDTSSIRISAGVVALDFEHRFAAFEQPAIAIDDI